MTPDIVRAARALLGWDQVRLSAESLVSVSAVRNFERGAGQMTPANRAALRRAIEAAGVRVLEEDEAGGPGVRWRGDHGEA